MPEARNPLAEVLSLLGQPAQQIANITKTLDSFRTAVAGFFDAVQTFRTTMESLDGVATRLNGLLDDIEPLRALTPQVAKAAQRADRLVDTMAGPLDRLAPQLSQLADTLAAPAISNLPRQLDTLFESFGDLPSQFGALGRVAQTAGGLFGIRAPAPPTKAAKTATPATAARPKKVASSKRATTKKAAKRTSATFKEAAARRSH